MALDPYALPTFPPCGETRAENEPRVRELIARVRALIARENEDCMETNYARLRALEEIEFGLGGLLPPIGVRVGIRRDGEIGSVEMTREVAA